MNKKISYGYIPVFISVIIINSLFSVYFLSIFLAGVVFKIFVDSLKNGYYYMMMLSVAVFLYIETVHGIKLFSLSIISVFVYYLILPKIRHVFSLGIINQISFIFLFYISFFTVIFFTNGYYSELYFIFIVNFLIDSFVAGFLL